MTGKRWTPGDRLDPPEAGEEIVISGIAGRFPDSDNVKHLGENLLNKVDLISDDDRRWKADHPEIPQRTGKLYDIEKFDALFFGVHSKQAHSMDPMCRMLLEHAYEAIVDAGVNPRQLRGTRTGVFIGACFSESEKTWFYEKNKINAFGITGCSRAMFANRISYWLGLTGPSYTVDTACSSSLFAMEHAYRAIKDGLCDAALVGGANICLLHYVSLQFFRLGVLSPDGRCKVFDADANGYARSEAIGVVYLQKSKDAKRIYASFVHAKTNCDGFKEQGITFPSSVMQSVLLQEFYQECGVAPSSLSYVEAHGTGTKVGDPEEVNALESVFCNGRTTPLRIGSVKSNLGHSEPASGLCSIAKVVIAMESGLIPPNLHFKRPREGVKALEDGRLQVITEATPWEGGYVGINSFGFGGANAHILLKSNPKGKVNGGAPLDALPRLVVVSGRTEEAVKILLDDIESRPVDVEYVGLLHNIHLENVPGHMYRGYTVMPPRGLPEISQRDILHYPGAKKPIWFVFSGMGSQWPGMGESLMRIPVFAEAIRKCDAVLKPHGVDIVDILTNREKKTFDNILNSFVGIAAVQIGLVDILTSIGIVPDNIIGHSVGELGCAYADGCFTADQMILSAYSRGLASIETKVIYGSMAAVGLGHTVLKDLCPPDIEIACHNGPKSCTISGPANSMREFVAKLKSNKIFAREVPCSNIPYHSRYINAAGPRLLSYLQRIIPEPKQRSSKWLSTSVPRSEWSTASAQLCSAEYHTNNLLSTVLFEETATMIPNDAVTIEIAPHGLLQAILRRSLNEGVTNVPLTQREHKDNVLVILQAIGKLYEAGLQPQLINFYPKVQFPVSRGTPMIAPAVKWDHSDDWFVASFDLVEKLDSGERVVEVTLADETYEYMSGHVIDGRNLLPATGYLALIWETLGMMKGELYTELSVVFEDVKFHRATTIPKEGSFELTLMIHRGTGRFEVFEGGTAVVTGMVRATTNPKSERINEMWSTIEEDEDEMAPQDVYKELRLRGYHYTGLFRGIKGATPRGTKGRIAWANNWVAFMDNMLQMYILVMESRGLFVPTSIQKLVIDTKVHLNQIRAMPDEGQEFPVSIHKFLDAIVSGGVEIRGLKASPIARRKPASEPVLEEYKFVAHRDCADISLKEATRLAAHLALENHHGIKIKTIEIIDEKDDVNAASLISPSLQVVLGDLPLLQADVSVYAPMDKFEEGSMPPTIAHNEPKKLAGESNALLVITRGLLASGNSESLGKSLVLSKRGGFILALEPLGDDNNIFATVQKEGLDVLLEKRGDNDLVLLLRKRDKLPKRITVVRIDSNEFSWVSEMKAAMKAESEKDLADGDGKVLLVGQGDFDNGLIGLVNCLRQEPGGEAVQGLLIQDPKAPEFSLQDPFYSEQVSLNLAVNVLRPGKVWGSYRHLALGNPIPKPVHQAWVNQLVCGDLGSLKWLEGPIQPGFKDKDLVRVTYSSLNFRDVMLATGKLATEVCVRTRKQLECVIGFEFCGTDIGGHRVMGLVECRGLSNLVIADPDLLWKVPDSWTLEDAATVPCVYTTCYYALYVSGKMKKGDKILIHAGTGGVGQAAITLALHEGCEVFTTVGTQQKREFLKEKFPQIDDKHIGNSRDTSFEQLILHETQGLGVDIVLNSLAEEKLQASVRCLAKHGRFLEIGKFDMAANNPLGMEPFLKEISFHGIMLDSFFTAPGEEKKQVKKLMDEGMRKGAIKPLTRTVFAKDQIEAAFRYMAAGKHIGKVILKVQDENDSVQSPILGLPRYHCLADRSYLILGGLGGFGLELADWLVLRGANKIVLTSRRGISNGYQRMRIQLWRSYGVQVVIVAGKDASTREGCAAVLKEAAMLGPVDAIFNLAVLLKDGLFENQTEETFRESFEAKAFATKRLDELSRTVCPLLRHFVVFSSVSCGRGNAGQSNYGMANSVMERICERRVAEGLPGLTIQWGAVGDVGLVAEMQLNHVELVIGGTLQQGITSCLRELDGFLRQSCPIVSSMVVADKRASGTGSTNIVDAVLNIMGLKDLKTVSQYIFLNELGMDSMMAVEIKQTLEREFEVFLTAQDIRTLTFAKLSELSLRQAANEKDQTMINGRQDEDLSGLKLFVRLLGDEDISTEVCVKLNTREEDGRGEVFVIPGVEGFASVFKPLAEKIRSPATCLQFGTERTNSRSIDDMVDHLLPHVKARSEGRSDFVIAGYSFGALVAIEMARRLESEGMTGRLVLIDGAPDHLKALSEQQLSASTEDQLQNTVLLGIMDLFAPAISAEVVVALEKCTSWDERLAAFLTRIPKEGLYLSPDNQAALCMALYVRLKAVLDYDPSALPLIEAPITLLRPTLQSLKSGSEDYGLQKLTRGRVGVHYAEGNHFTILESSLCAAAIDGEHLEDTSVSKEIMIDGGKILTPFFAKEQQIT